MAGDTPNDPGVSGGGRARPPRAPWRRPSERAATAPAQTAPAGQGGASDAKKKQTRTQRILGRVREFLVLALKTLLLIVVLVCIIFFNRIVQSVYPGEMGVLWSRLGGGTVLDRTYTEGMYIIWPWDNFYIYDMREQELEQTTLVYARDGLEISVVTSIRFRPTMHYLPRLHQDLGPNYVHKVITPEVTSSVRKVLGNFAPEDIYAKDEEGLIGELNSILREDLNAEFFEVTEFLVKELQLPDRIELAIQRKLEAEQDMLAYRFFLIREKDEKERRIIEAEGLRAFETISGISVLRWRAIKATETIANSPNAKVILAGTGENQLPVLLSADLSTVDSPAAFAPETLEPTKGKQVREPGSARLVPNEVEKTKDAPAEDAPQKPGGAGVFDFLPSLGGEAEPDAREPGRPEAR